MATDLFGTPTPDTLQVARTADLSPCGVYRYRLTRHWDSSLPRVRWVMVNPSTADASVDDPTIRRCMAFSRAWGCGSLVVVNLYAYRATDPDDLIRQFKAGVDVVGPDNDAAIVDACGTGLTVAAWGAQHWAQQRAKRVLTLLRLAGARLHRIGVTKDGMPRHPLYVRGDAVPVSLTE